MMRVNFFRTRLYVLLLYYANPRGWAKNESTRAKNGSSDWEINGIHIIQGVGKIETSVIDSF